MNIDKKDQPFVHTVTDMVPKASEAVSDTLKKLRAEYPDSSFVMALSDTVATTLDAALDFNGLTFSHLALFEGDEALMLKKIQELTYAVDAGARKKVAGEIVTLIEASL